LQALGPNSPSLEATAEQIKVLSAQADGVDPGRIFRICDHLAELDEKIRGALSVRTIIEMALLRAARIATTASVEELLRTVRSLKSGSMADSRAQLPEPPVSAAKPSASEPVVSSPEQVPSKPEPVAAESREAILSDPKLAAILAMMPGATVADIKEVK